MVKLDIFHYKQPIHFSAILILLSIFEVVWTLYTPARAQDSRPAETIALPQAYWDAVEDARIPKTEKIFRNLTAITHENHTLTWDDKGRVLVTIWTTWRGYTKNVGHQLILNQDTWVTAVPDLRNFCKNYTPTTEIPLAKRLNQLLGLPPDKTDQRQVAEIWVDSKFLFRPSPDPEITDHEAELKFRTLNEFISVSLSYQNWFYKQYDQRYQDHGQPMTPYTVLDPKHLPYPWTQLGYTYDWGNPSDWANIDQNRPKHIGLSEFVIHQWSPILVKSTQGAESYCH